MKYKATHERHYKNSESTNGGGDKNCGYRGGACCNVKDYEKLKINVILRLHKLKIDINNILFFRQDYISLIDMSFDQLTKLFAIDMWEKISSIVYGDEINLRDLHTLEKNISSFECIKKRLFERSNGMICEEFWQIPEINGNVVIAGGLIVDLVNNNNFLQSSDIDIYIYGLWYDKNKTLRALYLF